MRQRVFGLACGYADCNDAARLTDDPTHKLLLERDPCDGLALGTQPILWDAFRRYYGSDSARVLVWKADTVAP